jgi:hypothetical protein
VKGNWRGGGRTHVLVPEGGWDAEANFILSLILIVEPRARSISGGMRAKRGRAAWARH